MMEIGGARARLVGRGPRAESVWIGVLRGWERSRQRDLDSGRRKKVLGDKPERRWPALCRVLPPAGSFTDDVLLRESSSLTVWTTQDGQRVAYDGLVLGQRGARDSARRFHA